MQTFWASSFATNSHGMKYDGDTSTILPDLSSPIAQASEQDIKTKRLIQWNVDVLLGKLKLLVAHREASKLQQHLPGMEQVQSASTAILNLPGVEQVSSASSAIMSLPGIKQTSSVIRNLPGQASSAFLSLPVMDQASSALNRRPSLAMDSHTTLEEVQGMLRECCCEYYHKSFW